MKPDHKIGTWQAIGFTPLSHMLKPGIISVVDLRLTNTTKDMLDENRKEKGGYKIEETSQGEPHVHLNL
ncbi:MAG: hypothetical protein ACRC0X_03775 [Brevinema sp.]